MALPVDCAAVFLPLAIDRVTLVTSVVVLMVVVASQGLVRRGGGVVILVIFAAIVFLLISSSVPVLLLFHSLPIPCGYPLVVTFGLVCNQYGYTFITNLNQL